MMSTNTDDLRIQNLRELVVPEALIAELPAEGPLAEHVNASRMVIQSILECCLGYFPSDALARLNRRDLSTILSPLAPGKALN